MSDLGGPKIEPRALLYARQALYKLSYNLQTELPKCVLVNPVCCVQPVFGTVPAARSHCS